MFRRAFHKTLIVAGVVAGVVLGSHAAFAENRVALVIGQSAYRAVTALPNPANDAKAMSQLLADAGFDVTSAADLSQNEMRQKVGEFAAKVAAKGPDTVALVFYAGHGLQIDGENFLVPVDVDPKREADIPLQAVRLNDILNTLTSVPSKMRILCSMPAVTTRSPTSTRPPAGDSRSSTPGPVRRAPSCRFRPRRARKLRTAAAPTARIRRRCWQPPRSPAFRSRTF